MRVDILGVGFDNVTMDQAVAEGLRLSERRGGPLRGHPQSEIVTLR